MPSTISRHVSMTYMIYCITLLYMRCSTLQADRQADGRADRQTGRQADRQTGRQADRQTGRQAGMHASKYDVYVYIHIPIPIYVLFLGYECCQPKILKLEPDCQSVNMTHVVQAPFRVCR